MYVQKHLHQAKKSISNIQYHIEKQIQNLYTYTHPGQTNKNNTKTPN